MPQSRPPEKVPRTCRRQNEARSTRRRGTCTTESVRLATTDLLTLASKRGLWRMRLLRARAGAVSSHAFPFASQNQSEDRTCRGSSSSACLIGYSTWGSCGFWTTTTYSCQCRSGAFRTSVAGGATSCPPPPITSSGPTDAGTTAPATCRTPRGPSTSTARKRRARRSYWTGKPSTLPIARAVPVPCEMQSVSSRSADSPCSLGVQCCLHCCSEWPCGRRLHCWRPSLRLPKSGSWRRVLRRV
mmetsp:Transcript_12422/g.43814  ORF Transcript_12422/g.43814 Transcript_12422/m.43814 type:complete len:243 (-) Transcript_12422:147-875(-)